MVCGGDRGAVGPKAAMCWGAAEMKLGVSHGAKGVGPPGPWVRAWAWTLSEVGSPWW